MNRANGLLETLQQQLASACQIEEVLDNTLNSINGTCSEAQEEKKGPVGIASTVGCLQDTLVRIKDKADSIYTFLNGPDRTMPEKKR